MLARHEADTVALAGYLRAIPAPVVWAFRGRMLNVHPSLLPAFGGPGMYGRRVHEAVLDYGCRLTGATVHMVDAGLDTGPIVLQEAVHGAARTTRRRRSPRPCWPSSTTCCRARCACSPPAA